MYSSLIKPYKKTNSIKDIAPTPSAVILFICLSLVSTVAVYKISLHQLNKYKPGWSNNTVQSINNPRVKVPEVPKAPPDNNKAIIPDNFIPPVKDGLAPVISRITTSQNVVFLGIDDGGFKDQKVIDIMQKNNIKASLFLADRFISSNRDFFKALIPLGSKIENHTLSHVLLSNLSYQEQLREICGMAELEEKIYGRRPILFRPPGGNYNTDTQRAAATCGMKAVVLWIAKANGGSMQYQYDKKLQKGDIVLMHFRPEFEQDMQAFVKAQNAAGLQTTLLDSWVK